MLGVTAVPGRYSSWIVLNPLKCRVARLNINHSLYHPGRCLGSLREPEEDPHVVRVADVKRGEGDANDRSRKELDR